ncbi:MAG: 1,4-alpha-glucan branching enzyme, partial [Acidobacteria bacterium]|nr:1,4-alpha-glucan branching enzyme [Acidobacteriota bacterium]
MVQHEIEAIAGAYHGDPFHYLGPHQLPDVAGKPAWEVRAFLPQAESAAVILHPHGAAIAVPMKKVHPHGGFVAELPVSPDDYHFRISRWNGTVEQVEDPYRFPPLLTDFELHLHGEGTHWETYKMLGAHLTESLGVPGVRFSVWAPNAETVAVVGDFNEWDTRRHPMRL